MEIKRDYGIVTCQEALNVIQVENSNKKMRKIPFAAVELCWRLFSLACSSKALNERKQEAESP